MYKKQSSLIYKLPVKSLNDQIYDAVFDKMSGSYKLFVALGISLFIIITKSVAEFLLSTIIVVGLIKIFKKNVKYCFNLIKSVSLWLLFISLFYIMIYKDCMGLLVLDIKFLYIILCNVCIIGDMDFEQLNKGINYLFKPLNKLTKNLYNFTFNLTIILYTFENYIDYSSKKASNSYKEIENTRQKKRSATANYIKQTEQFLKTIKVKNYPFNRTDKLSHSNKMRIFIVYICLLLLLYIF